MHVLVLTNSLASVPCLEMIQSRSQLSGILSPGPLSEESSQLSDWAALRSVPFFTVERHSLESDLKQFLAEFSEPLILSFGFPWPLPDTVLTEKPFNFYNVHFSLLPGFAGPAPVFWQVRLGVTRGGVSLHRIVKRLDAGPLVSQTVVQLLPGESMGLYTSRLSVAAVPLVESLLAKFIGHLDIPELAQDVSKRTYYKRPSAQDLEIDWEQDTADSIVNLVGACNPAAGGALTFYKRTPLQILEVSPADGTIDPETAPGTIVYADAAHGVFVVTSDDKILRINVAKLAEGIYSGGRLATIGFSRGERFHSHPRIPLPTIQHSFSHH
jgi:methionyl-tRNA formyltransferase